MSTGGSGDSAVLLGAGRRGLDAPRLRGVGSTRPAAEQLPDVEDELHARLSKLGELRQAGVLTDEEFAHQKARLLGQ